MIMIQFQEAQNTNIIAEGETWGSSWGDFNQDSYPDLYVNNHRETAALYINQQDGTFQNVVNEAFQTVPDNDRHGAAWNDFDNDGDLDLVQLKGGGSGFGVGSPNAFFVNENGVLVERAQELGVTYPNLRGRTPLLTDYDKDGRLDLVVTGIMRLDGTNAPPAIFRQTDDGFIDVSQETNFNLPKGDFGVLTDLSRDGTLDLLFAGSPLTAYDTSSQPFENIRNELFASFFRGADFSPADFNGDLKIDLFVRRTGMSDILLINTEEGLVDQSVEAGISQDTLLGINSVAGDFDNDGDVDIYVLNHTQTGNAANFVYENQGDGTFEQVQDAGGAAGTLEGRSEAVTTADYNLDGFLDLFVSNGRDNPDLLRDNPPPYQLFENQGNENRWLQVDLQGVETNRDGIGSTVFVTANGVTQIREQGGGLHRRAQDFSRLHFGLGQANQVSQLEVRWTNGIVQKLGNLDVNQVLTVEEGIGLTGNDLISGTETDNRLEGSLGNDRLRGFQGDDLLRGEAGSDTLVGDAGNDILVGGQAGDLIRTGSGRDRIRYFSRQDGGDVIQDFSVFRDTIEIRGARFGGALGRGLLDSSQFVIGTRAQDRNDRFIYDDETGNLFFDRNGSINGSSNLLLLATLSNQPNLRSSNIRVF